MGKLIAVIADDLTGAAELGGIGLRYGLKVEVVTEVRNASPEAELLVVAADTRSGSQQQAEIEMAIITRQLLLLSPHMIFKKIDSVLRGHILAEINVQLKEMHLYRALIVPENPQLGRSILNKIYYVNGDPIHVSSFSKDPDFPVSSSYISDMLRSNDAIVQVIAKGKLLPEKGIIVGEAENKKDLKTWALQADKNTLLAGASGFFEALLKVLGYRAVDNKKMVSPKLGTPTLFICGTAFKRSREAIKTLWKEDGPVSYMPGKMTELSSAAESDYQSWSKEILSLLRLHGKAVMAINADTTKDANPNDLREKMAETVSLVVQENQEGELVIEGGATASAIIKKQGFKRLTPLNELMPGVIRMRVDDRSGLFLTLKPGSYHWPIDLWNF